MQNLEIIICTEKGRLESMSKLLAYSIRKFGGRLKDAPVYSYSPRKGSEPSTETRAYLESQNVVCVTKELNSEYQEYPLANKPLVSAYHEERSAADYLLFIDSDSLIIDDPVDLIPDKTDVDVRINPVVFPNIATDIHFAKGDAGYWRGLYTMLDVNRRKEVVCQWEKSRVLEYYNSGFVLAKSSKAVFQRWAENFRLVMKEGLSPGEGPYFTEQSVLSATIAQMDLNVLQLGRPYNYPISTYAKKWRGFYPYSLKGVRHVHYHKLFENRDKNSIEGKLSRIPNGELLNSRIEDFLLVKE
jgi:hypothetical protein